jgi:ribosomal protein S18 acetylase RimI-like enzyme
MAIKIIEESLTALPDYSTVPIAFTVASRLRIETINQGLGGLKLVEEKITPPYIKDYDQITGEGPTNWARRWDISHWGILSAFQETERVGGAAVAWQTSEIDLLEGREDIAALWDIRVATAYRHQGIGSQLFRKAVEWGQKRNCRLLKIETQNINVAACRFYAAQGCELRGIHVGAYSDYPEEVQLLWYLAL